MRKNIGFFTLENNKNKIEEQILYDALKDKYSIAFFNWKEFNNHQIIDHFYSYSGKEFLGRHMELKEFDLLHILGMGKFEGRENDVLSFFHNLGNLKENIIINKPHIMIKNLDKTYLISLQNKGINVVPTMEVDYGTSKNEIIKNFEKKFNKSIEDIVLKPKVFGERSNAVVRLSEMDENDLEKYYIENGNRGVLSQEYVLTINKYYERSLVYIDRNFSHALIRYKDNEGWLPSQGNDGRKPEEIQPTKEEKDLCEKIFKIKGENYTYITRFDFLGPRDAPLISEVEEINPGTHIDKISDKSLSRFIGLYRNFLKYKLD